MIADPDADQFTLTPSHSSTGTINEKMSVVVWAWQYIWTDVDPDQSSGPLAACYFMTGYVNGVAYTAMSVWCGFQTGSTIELAHALARPFSLSEIPGPLFRIVDRQSLTSIIAFLMGAFLGRMGDRIGSRSRGWLLLGSFVQALFTMAAGILLWKGGKPSFSTNGPTWTNVEGYAAIAFISASMGLQGIMAKRMNTQFATTIVLTTLWCELMAEPQLFCLRYVKTRDLKIVAVSSLLLGGFIGRILLDMLGSSTTFLIGAGFRVVIALLWLGIPGRNPADNMKEKLKMSLAGKTEKGGESV